MWREGHTSANSYCGHKQTADPRSTQEVPITRLCPNIPLLVLPPAYVQTVCCWFHKPFMSKLSVVGSISRLCPNIPLLVLPPVYVQTLCCWFHHPFMSKYSVAGSAPVNVQIFCCWFHHPLMSKHSVVGSNTRSTQCLAFLLTQRRCPVQSRCLLRLRRLVFVFSSGDVH